MGTACYARPEGNGKGPTSEEDRTGRRACFARVEVLRNQEWKRKPATISPAQNVDRWQPAARRRQRILSLCDNYYCQVLRDPLDTQLREIAWTQASRRWEPPGGVVPADPRNYDASDEERLAGCLGLLHSYTHMVKLLQRRIDLTVDAALARGASYGQIAAMCGISRQAVRQRRLRHDQQTEPHRVRPSATASDQQRDLHMPDAQHRPLTRHCRRRPKQPRHHSDRVRAAPERRSGSTSSPRSSASRARSYWSGSTEWASSFGRHHRLLSRR